MRVLLRFILVFIFAACCSVAYCQHDKLAGVFSVTACPAENCENSMSISWATDTSIRSAVVEVARLSDKMWKGAVKYEFQGVLCTTFDGVYSKGLKGENFYENVVINKYNATVGGLKKDTEYKYRIYPVKSGNGNGDGVCRKVYHSAERYFQTAGAKEWEACVISDFHVYSPLYGRTRSAMEMISTVEKYAENGDLESGNKKNAGVVDWVLHLGDITAWGGSYSFWKNLYKEMPFKKYMWAGVNGNHDNMTRGYDRTTNEFFRDASAYPMNGYEGEMGVCYHFRYGDVLFIMLNNEGMRSDEGLAAAQAWVRSVVESEPAPYIVVCEHYQWFYGESGKESQYSRWCDLFDELGVSLAMAGNNHIYVSTPALYGSEVVSQDELSSGKGTVYIQTPSSDNERGVEVDLDTPLKHSSDKIKFRWSEGANTVGAMHMKVTPKKMILTLLNRTGEILDVTEIYPSM